MFFVVVRRDLFFFGLRNAQLLRALTKINPSVVWHSSDWPALQPRVVPSSPGTASATAPHDALAALIAHLQADPTKLPLLTAKDPSGILALPSP